MDGSQLNGLTYDFSALHERHENMHSVETVLNIEILIFSWTSDIW